MKATESEKLHQLNTILLTESPEFVRAPVYAFTETPDNALSVLLRCEALLRWNRVHCGTPSVFLIDNLGGSEPGYPGADEWTKRLLALGVPEKQIQLIPFREPLLHTLSEAFAMVRFAKERKWKQVVIVAPPFHLLRCFLSAVTAVQHEDTDLRVYCHAGVTQPWREHVVHSQ